MRTIKIIELLNMISKGEEVPEKIKVHNTEYHKCLLNTGIDYKIYSDDFYYLSNEICIAGFSLNDEVEILEEEKKIPERLFNCCMHTDNEEIKFLIQNINDLADKFNEIIDYLESKEKGE